MVLDIVFMTGQTFSLEIKTLIKNKDGSMELILPDDSKFVFNPNMAILWGVRKGDMIDDKAEGTSTLSS